MSRFPKLGEPAQSLMVAADEQLHKLWTVSGTLEYKKSDWQELEKRIHAFSELDRRLGAAVAMLVEIQNHKYHEPNSDFYERCADCGRSPHNVPPHTEGCLVPRLAKLIAALA